MKKLILIRHGQTEINKNNSERCLTRTGQVLIKHQAKLFKKHIVNNVIIIYSPTIRAKQTAEIIGKVVHPTTIVEENLRIANADNINEIVYKNQMKGISAAQTYLELVNYNKFSVESPVELFKRFEGIFSKYQTDIIILVSHEGSLDGFLKAQNKYLLIDKTFDQYFDYGDYAILEPIDNVKIQHMLEPIVEKNNQLLTKLDIGFTNLEHPPIKEIFDCMRYLGLPISEGFSTLIMKADNKYVAIIRRDDCKLDLNRACKIIGCKKLHIASPSEFEELTHLPSGAAFVINPGLTTYFDLKLFEKDYLMGGSGSLSVTNKYTTADLKKIPDSHVVDIADISSKKRILTGDRPTGPLHLGHFVGTLKNRVLLQDEYDCFFIMADLHTLTTAYSKDKTSTLNDRVRGLVLDYLSVGIDPSRSVIYQQSRVPEVAYLSLIFSNLVTVPRAQRVPTLKDVMHDLRIEQPSMGLLNYPVLQAADILMVKANLVPVGKDQQSHVEVTREVARDFNRLYSSIFPIPEAMIGDIGSLVGTDGGAKMSKSVGNCIYLSDDAATVEKKVRSMYTDPTRIRPTDPGHVEGNPVFIYHDAFNDNPSEVADLKARYQQGTVGDVEVKTKLALALNRFLDPIRTRRARYVGKNDLLDQIIDAGSQKARLEAQKTLAEVLTAMGIRQ